ncbi:hypothetical protein JK358_31575 [Nocardia sp. 2]|uniref:Mce-associated membrane protein n=1 Tax=Nocardia acididurans TaxID=2802282 RepID=A0ABS1MH09_9NOCA|nr:hypothetical protein [Nocardia acididurans]MBL1078954.1 hypothetical protein [Nocardia acididurans]
MSVKAGEQVELPATEDEGAQEEPTAVAAVEEDNGTKPPARSRKAAAGKAIRAGKPVARAPRTWREREIPLTRKRLAGAVIATAVLLGGSGAVCGYFALERSSAADAVAAGAARQDDRDAASASASTFLSTMFTVNDSSLTRWDATVLDSTTDGMHEQLAQWRGVLEKLVGAKVQMSSVIKDIGIVAQDGDAITLLAVIESTGNADPASTQPGVSNSAALIDMRKIDGRWKVQGYGPAGGIPAVPSAPATDAPATDAPASDAPATTAPDATPR